MTELQRQTYRAVAQANREGRWYRASSKGQRVTLASLYRGQALQRRVWRYGKSDADNAHEYAVPADVARALEIPALADADARPCKVCNKLHAIASEFTPSGVSDFCSRSCLQISSTDH